LVLAKKNWDGWEIIGNDEEGEIFGTCVVMDLMGLIYMRGVRQFLESMYSLGVASASCDILNER
jgi:hypothetical protein